MRVTPTFRALLLENAGGAFTATFKDLPASDLPAGEVLIRVGFSSLNYKDGLAVLGRPGVVRKFPMVPGVDLAGTVEESTSNEFKSGDRVVVTGCGTSETMWGGYAQYARLDARYVLHLPAEFSLEEAMAIGTAGFTSMQSVMALEAHGVKPGGREILVTGAAGGVGSVAIAILANLGYKVVAATGRTHESDYLKELGASEVIDRAVLAAPGKPLETERWGGAIDSAGGEVLAGALRAMAVGASVASCGLAGGAAVQTTVYPFILRGVNLLGIDSVRPSQSQRQQVWKRLATDLPAAKLRGSMTVEPLSGIFPLAESILRGGTRGRVVIDVNA